MAAIEASLTEEAADRWEAAVMAAALFAIDPIGLGGVVLKGLPGPARDRWLSLTRSCLPEEAPMRRMPAQTGLDRLLGGLDLSATLSAGRPVLEQGVLAASDGGCLLLAMAERLPEATAAIIAGALDRGDVHVERDGFAARNQARFGVIALDESLDDEDRPSAALRDRLAFEIDLGPLSHRDLGRIDLDRKIIAASRERLKAIRFDDASLEGLTGAALALGIFSLRAPILALRAAAASAALHDRFEIDPEDAALAARLVLAHRATRLPPEDSDQTDEADDQPEQEQEPEEQDEREADDDQSPADQALEDQLLEAALAALPPGLLDALRTQMPRSGTSASSGRAGAKIKTGLRGRPAGVRPGRPGGGERLSVIETLRAAAPWQPLRRKQRPQDSSMRLDVRPSDFRIIRQKEPNRTTTIFAVDASGSSAFERLAEAKGAVELLLAECYTRRDQVALLAFRGSGAEVLLTPTRSLLRAKRSLAGLPGGGGTPLASGVQFAHQLAEVASRRGDTPLLVFLTDGRGNIALDGAHGRPRAMSEAETSARQVAAAGHAALVIDISARPGPQAEALAAALGGRYLALPRADAKALSGMVIAARER